MAEDINQNETFLNPSRRSYVYESSKNSGNKKRIILIFIGILILVALVAFAIIATGGKGESEKDITPSPSQSVISPTITPTVAATETPKTTPTPTTKTTPTPTTTSTTDKKTGLDRADLTIAVENGSGVAGAATKMSDALKKLGYDVVSSGNADSFDYATTEIQVKSTKKTYLPLLKSDLSTDYTIGSATADYTGSEANAVVIVGKQ